jgi:hypothetical protein
LKSGVEYFVAVNELSQALAQPVKLKRPFDEKCALRDKRRRTRL